MAKFLEQIRVEIPRWQREYVFKSDVKPVYYKKGMKLPPSYKKRITEGKYTWKNLNGTQSLWHVKNKKFIPKNPKLAGNPKVWNVNGQNFCSLHWRIKAEITEYFKRYFSGFIVQQIDTINMDNKLISVSCDIYEEIHTNLPDIDNLAWVIRKWFTDTLHENNIIPDDNHKFITETGKFKYHFVGEEKDRKLIFKINVYER
jgi:hypothetical protein